MTKSFALLLVDFSVLIFATTIKCVTVRFICLSLFGMAVRTEKKIVPIQLDTSRLETQRNSLDKGTYIMEYSSKKFSWTNLEKKTHQHIKSKEQRKSRIVGCAPGGSE